MNQQTIRTLIDDGFSSSLVEHCNLNCHHCGSWAPLAKPSFLTVESFEKDWTKMAELKPDIKEIVLTGGEPTLHPKLLEFVKIARQLFPHSTIKIITNGLLLTKFDQNFWEALDQYNARLVITRYPININERIIRAILKEYELEAEWEPTQDDFDTLQEQMGKEKGTTPYRIMFTHPIDASGNQDIDEAWDNCYQRGNCVKIIRDGNLYACTFCAKGYHLNDAYNLGMKFSDNDYIKIHDVQHFDEILEFMSRPVPSCKYCNIYKGVPCLDYQYGR